MQWIGTIVNVSQLFGLLGIVLGTYVYMRTRNITTAVATLPCAVGFLAPFFGTSVPLYQVLYPHSVHGVVISLVLTVGPWFYLLPFTVPAKPKTKQRVKAKR